MILAKSTLSQGILPEQVAFVLEQAVTALKAAAEDGSEVARYGLEDVARCMSYIGGDIEVQADREEEVQALFAELAAEDGAGDELPPILVDPGFEGDFWGEAA